jgi:hypothetical protein
MATFYKKGYVVHATECFIDGKRVPTKAEVDAGTARALTQYVLVFLALVHVFSDGCSRQYAGRKNYFKVAEFFSLLGLIMLQHTAEAHCFKGVWDGYGKDPKKGARDAVRTRKVILPTTKPWFDWCVKNLEGPARKESIRGEDNPEGKTVFGANRYVWVYYKGSVWDGKDFDAKKLPASKSYLDVKGRLAAAAHCTEGTFPLYRRWLWCFCPGCRAVDAADAAAVEAHGAGGGAVAAGAHRCLFEKWVGQYGIVNTCAATAAGIRAAKNAGVTKFMTSIEPGGLLVVLGVGGT